MKLKNNIIGASLTLSPRFTANFTKDELTLKLGEQQYAWPIVAIAGIEFVPGLIWASARITTLDGQKLQLDGIDETKGIRWHAAFMALLYQQVASAGNQASIRCARWLPKILKQLPDSWHPSWMGNHLMKTTPPETLPCGLTIDQVTTHPAIKGASEAYPHILPTLPLRPIDVLNAHLRQLNEAFFEQRKTLPLFDTLEATPLTEEQRRGVICFV